MKRAKASTPDWKPLSDSLITARLRSTIGNVTIFQCSTPTEGLDQQVKGEFYDKLDKAIRSANKRDIKIVMGDLNPNIGHENKGLELIIGAYGLGERNVNGELFIDLCANHELVIGESLFPHRKCHKVTWVSPGHETENQIDHIAISKKFRSSLLNVRNKRGPDVGSDHHLVLAEVRLKLVVNKFRTEQRGETLDIRRLKDENI
jgi:hypothetical protein